MHLTTVGAELAKHPQVILLKSSSGSLKKILLSAIFGKEGVIEREKTILAPHFRRSMYRAIDPRRPELEQGLGVIDEDDRGKYYPLTFLPKGETIHDVWQGRALSITRSELDGVPFATWDDNDEPPMQLLTRWYGFSFTYPNCEVYESEKDQITNPA